MTLTTVITITLSLCLPAGYCYCYYQGFGAAYGTAKSGVGIAAMGVMRPELIMKNVVPVVMVKTIVSFSRSLFVCWFDAIVYELVDLCCLLNLGMALRILVIPLLSGYVPVPISQ